MNNANLSVAGANCFSLHLIDYLQGKKGNIYMLHTKYINFKTLLFGDTELAL